MPDPSEYGATARVVTSAAGAVAATVQETHRAIARRVPFLRMLPRPVRAVQETATSLIYLAVRGGIAAVGAASTIALDTAPRTRDARPLSGNARGRRIAGVVDGAFGSHLDARRHPGLSGPMSVRIDGVGVGLDAADLARHHPAATGRLVVLLHGLIETEEWWGPTDGDIGARLTQDLDATCVRIRYNSGQPIAASGAELDALLDDLVAAWPVPIDTIAMIGHSMGGLVARHALVRGVDQGRAWPGLVRHLVCLGTPHLGSPVERGAAALAGLLANLPETAPAAALIDSRSAGIKDLAVGWSGPDTAPVTLQRGNIAATLSRDPRDLLGRAVGDLLVQPASALPASPPARSAAIGGISHFALMSNDEVYALIREWLENDDQ